jgi:DNA-binding beta-propeller fold protein YncE
MMTILHLLTCRAARQACTRALRLAAAAVCVLAAGALAAPAAFASPGDLTFVNCTGLLPSCTGTSPWDAVTYPDAVAVTRDGTQLYTASATNGDISSFGIDRAGNLSFEGCFGYSTGCASSLSTFPRLNSIMSLAVTPDGRNLYAAAGSVFGYGAVLHFSIGDRGGLTFVSCTGQIHGCGWTQPPDLLNGLNTLVMTPDGKNLYTVGSTGYAVSHFLIDTAGNLTFDGCIGNNPDGGCAGISAGTISGADVLAVTPDGRNLYATSSQSGGTSVYHFAIDGAGNLHFGGCTGTYGGCRPVSTGGALNGAASMVAAPDGRNLYLAASVGNAVSRFKIDGTGNLLFAGCTGDQPGCTVTSPAGALDGANALAATSDGAGLYAAGGKGSVIVHFTFDAFGNLVFAGCTGELGGCTGTRIIHALDGADALAVTQDSTQLYAAGFTGDDISHFTIAGFSSR